MRWACLVACSLVACQAGEPAPPPGPPANGVIQLSAAGMRNAEVTWVTLLPSTFAPHLETTATITADAQNLAKVGAQMAGRVAAINVRLGDEVRRGQALLEIDTVELHHVSTDYLTSLARAREADDALARQKELVAERVGALQELRRAEATQQMADAARREAEEHLHFLGLDDGAIRALRTGSGAGPLRSVLRAPIAGRVEALSVSLGQVLTGSEDLLTIMHLNKVWATLRIYERDLNVVKKTAVVEVKVSSYPGRIFPGRIASVSDLVDSNTRTVEVRATVENQDERLKPGMSAVAMVVLQAETASLWLPSEAVQPHGLEHVVFVRLGEGRFVARPVVVGEVRGGFVPLQKGAAQGDEVVVHGAFALRGELERGEMQGD